MREFRIVDLDLWNVICILSGCQWFQLPGERCKKAGGWGLLSEVNWGFGQLGAAAGWVMGRPFGAGLRVLETAWVRSDICHRIKTAADDADLDALTAEPSPPDGVGRVS